MPTLYKFKPVAQLQYVLDIVLHKRLYCQSYDRLNDPFEGQLRTMTGGNLGFGFSPGMANFNHSNFSPRTARVVHSGLHAFQLEGPRRICSLTDQMGDPRMWALYADSFHGVAIEIEFEDGFPDLHQVQYVRDFPKVATGLLNPGTTLDVLTHKTYHWEYEREFRLITDLHTVDVSGRVRSVLLGHRMTDAARETLEVICRTAGVAVVRTELDPAGACVREL